MIRFPLRLRYCLLANLLLLLLSLSPPALAGNISFSLSLTNNRLTVTNRGDSSTYYSEVLRLLPDGRWVPIAAAPFAPPPVELTPGGNFDLPWPDPRPPEKLTPLERLRPLMIRFFDQAGVSFGQISFFNHPPVAEEILQAGYDNGLMAIDPPSPASSGIRASWLLWPQEEGIGPLRAPVLFEHVQPAAKRFEWRAGMEKLRLSLGAGQPSAMLLHETDQGFSLQTISGGGLQGRQQRSPWLNGSMMFFGAAALLMAAALGAMVFHLLLSWRRKVRA